jgi:hypothetical protein
MGLAFGVVFAQVSEKAGQDAPSLMNAGNAEKTEIAEKPNNSRSTLLRFPLFPRFPHFLYRPRN